MAKNAVLEKQKSATETERKEQGGVGHVPYSTGLMERGADGPTGKAAEARGQPRKLFDVFRQQRASLLVYNECRLDR